MSVEEHDRLKAIVSEAVASEKVLKASVFKYKDEFHVMTNGVRSVYKSREDACKFASMFFLYASITPEETNNDGS